MDQTIHLVNGHNGHLLALNSEHDGVLGKALDPSNPDGAQAFHVTSTDASGEILKVHGKHKWLAYGHGSTVHVKDSSGAATKWQVSLVQPAHNLILKTGDGRCLAMHGHHVTLEPFTGSEKQQWWGISTHNNDELTQKVNEIEASGGGGDGHYSGGSNPPAPPVASGNICGNPMCGRTFICDADYNRNVQPMGYPGV